MDERGNLPPLNKQSENPASKIELSGYLVKRGKRVKSWLRRFFKLSNGYLTYYTEDGGKLKGQINIANAIIESVPADVFKRGHVFSIYGCNGEILYIQADGENDLKLWTSTLLKVASSAIYKEGSMQMQSAWRRRWKDRYFVLSGTKLTWYSSPESITQSAGTLDMTSRKPIAFIDLAGAHVVGQTNVYFSPSLDVGATVEDIECNSRTLILETGIIADDALEDTNSHNDSSSVLSPSRKTSMSASQSRTGRSLSLFPRFRSPKTDESSKEVKSRKSMSSTIPNEAGENSPTPLVPGVGQGLVDEDKSSDEDEGNETAGNPSVEVESNFVPQRLSTKKRLLGGKFRVLVIRAPTFEEATEWLNVLSVVLGKKTDNEREELKDEIENQEDQFDQAVASVMTSKEEVVPSSTTNKESPFTSVVSEASMDSINRDLNMILENSSSVSQSSTPLVSLGSDFISNNTDSEQHPPAIPDLTYEKELYSNYVHDTVSMNEERGPVFEGKPRSSSADISSEPSHYVENANLLQSDVVDARLPVDLTRLSNAVPSSISDSNVQHVFEPVPALDPPSSNQSGIPTTENIVEVAKAPQEESPKRGGLLATLSPFHLSSNTDKDKEKKKDSVKESEKKALVVESAPVLESPHSEVVESPRKGLVSLFFKEKKAISPSIVDKNALNNTQEVEIPTENPFLLSSEVDVHNSIVENVPEIDDSVKPSVSEGGPVDEVEKPHEIPEVSIEGVHASSSTQTPKRKEILKQDELKQEEKSFTPKYSLSNLRRFPSRAVNPTQRRVMEEIESQKRRQNNVSEWNGGLGISNPLVRRYGDETDDLDALLRRPGGLSVDALAREWMSRRSQAIAEGRIKKMGGVWKRWVPSVPSAAVDGEVSGESQADDGQWVDDVCQLDADEGSATLMALAIQEESEKAGSIQSPVHESAVQEEKKEMEDAPTSLDTHKESISLATQPVEAEEEPTEESSITTTITSPKWIAGPDDPARVSLRSRIFKYLKNRSSASADPQQAVYLEQTLVPELEESLYKMCAGDRALYSDPVTIKERLKLLFTSRREEISVHSHSADQQGSSTYSVGSSSVASRSVSGESDVTASALLNVSAESTEHSLDVSSSSIVDTPIRPLEVPVPVEDENKSQTAVPAARVNRRTWDAIPTQTTNSIPSSRTLPSEPVSSTMLQLESILNSDSSNASLNASRSSSDAQARSRERRQYHNVNDSSGGSSSNGRWGGEGAEYPGVLPPRHFPALEFSSVSLRLIVENRLDNLIMLTGSNSFINNNVYLKDRSKNRLSPPVSTVVASGGSRLPQLNKWQHRRCAECGAAQTTGMFGPKASFCHYSELLFCPTCFGSQKRPIPFRILHLLDDSPYPVCTAAAEFLDRIKDQPLVVLSAVSPLLSGGSRVLRRLAQLRARAIDLRDDLAATLAAVQLSQTFKRGFACANVHTQVHLLHDASRKSSGNPFSSVRASQENNNDNNEEEEEVILSEQGSTIERLLEYSSDAAEGVHSADARVRSILGSALYFLVQSTELLPLSLIVPLVTADGNAFGSNYVQEGAGGGGGSNKAIAKKIMNRMGEVVQVLTSLLEDVQIKLIELNGEVSVRASAYGDDDDDGDGMTIRSGYSRVSAIRNHPRKSNAHGYAGSIVTESNDHGTGNKDKSALAAYEHSFNSSD